MAQLNTTYPNGLTDTGTSIRKVVLPMADHNPSLEGRTLEAVGNQKGPFSVTFESRVSSGGYSRIYAAQLDPSLANPYGEDAYTRVLAKVLSVDLSVEDDCVPETSQEFFFHQLLYESLIAEGKGRHQYLTTPLDSGHLIDGENRLGYLMFPNDGARSVQDLMAEITYFDLDTTLHVLYTMAGVLSAFHDLGYLHRDVKPGNILLADQVPKLIDFGIAEYVSSGGVKGVISGTPSYLSPEQHMGVSLDGKTDVFSLAGTGLEMITGEIWHSRLGRINGDFSRVKVLHKTRKGEHLDYIRSLALPRNIVSLFVAAMEPSPENRIYMAEFEESLKVIIKRRAFWKKFWKVLNTEIF